MAFVAALIMAATAPHVTALAGCNTQGCLDRAKARAYAKLHGGCYSPRCTARVRRKAIIRETRRLTPYRCSFGRSAVPCAIVWCESKGRWDVANPSGAIGRYQLLGKGAPWPVRTRADRLMHHRIAARLWAGGRGAAHWAQCM